jgi:glucosamine--fructose-6-phosphate aminotransferase (isomerizing)
VGVTVADQGALTTFKAKGKIADLRKAIGRTRVPGTLAIGHTRWATHGKPSQKNAHPHLSCGGDIAVVHNGIIENHQALREFLKAKGHAFRSETDTEVVPHLIEYCYQGNLENGVTQALKEIHGTYGLAVVSSHERKMVVARKGSPLVIGIIGKGEYLVASDITAITEHTKQVVYLEDGDVGVLTDQGYRIFDINQAERSHCVKTINWSVSSIEKRGFDHYMVKEIFEQPETLKVALRGKYDAKNQVPKFGGINIPPFDLKQIERVVFLACGTSFHAGLVGEYYLEKFSGLKADVAYASEFLCKEEKLSSRDLVIPVSQSGETADTLMALRKANGQGAHSLGVVNTVGSTIAREVNGGGLYIHVGPEIGVASTKAYTGHLINLYLLSIYLGRVRGVRTTPDQIVVCGGFSQAVTLLCRALGRRGVTRVAVEDPCFSL